MKMSSKVRNQITGLAFVALPILGVTIFTGIPLVVSLVLSFSHLPSFDIFDMEMVGLKNYHDLFVSQRYWRSVGYSFAYAISTSALQAVLSLILAHFLSKPLKGRTIFRVILFIPYVCSVVALSIMWKWMLDGNFGIINDFLNRIGLSGVDWLNNSDTSFFCMILMSVWGGLGYGTILYSAALSSVDKSLYEAANVDGVSQFRQFLGITVPLISPTTFYLVVMGMISNLQAFANFQIMNPIGKNGQITTMVYEVWFYAFKADFMKYGLGYASAIGWVTGIIIIVFTFILFKTQKYWVHYEN